MNRTVKFSLAFAGLAAILLCTAFFVFNSLTASAAPTITFDSNTGILTISGDGEVTEEAVKTACSDDKSQITSVVFDSGSNITSIGANAFSDSDNLTSVTFAEGSKLTSIGNNAFNGCSSLTSIEIPAGVTSIGDSAFESCTNLRSVTFAEGSRLTSVGGFAFYFCTNLTSIEIPASVTSIGSSAFERCEKLTSVTFAEGSQLESINSAFYNCSALTSIEIPAGVTSIGDYAFYGCTKLTSVTFAEESQLTSVGGFAFYYCTNLTSIEIPASVTSIGNSVFYSCSSLTSIEIPAGVTSIGNSVFERCEKLTSIEIPAGVTSIGNSAFRWCDNITSVTFLDGSQLSSFGNTVFSYCFSLERIIYPEDLTSILDSKLLAEETMAEKMTKIKYKSADENLVITVIDPMPSGSFTVPEEIGDKAARLSDDLIAQLKADSVDIIHTKHIMVEIIKEPTCTEGGERTYACIYGDETTTEPIEAAGHNYADGECVVCGEKDPSYEQGGTETTPGVIEPEETDPSESETTPGVTEPEETDPSGSETTPGVTEPEETDPSGTEPVPGTTVTEPPAETTVTASTRTTLPPLVNNTPAASSAEQVLEKLADAADGSTVTIELKGNTTLDKSIFDEIAGRDVTVMIRLSGGPYWKINGRDIEKAKKVNMSVKMNSKAVSNDELKELAGDNKTVQFSLKHRGEFGFKAILGVPINKKYNNSYANLYYYNNGDFEFVGSSLISGGYAEFVFTHASDYVVVIDSEPYGEDVSAAAGMYEGNELTGKSSHAGIVMTVPVGILIAAVLRKRAKASR